MNRHQHKDNIGLKAPPITAPGRLPTDERIDGQIING
jgi:hypothetical protein